MRLAVVVVYFGGWLVAVIIAVIATMGAREVYRMAEAGGVPPLDGVGAPLAGLFVLIAEASAIDRAPLSWALLIGATLLAAALRSEEHTSELQSRENLVCRLLLEKKKRLFTRLAR